MRFLSVTLLGLTTLAAPFVLCSVGSGCNSLSSSWTALRESWQRGEALERDRQKLLRRIKERREVLEGLANGSLTLVEAGECIRQIDLKLGDSFEDPAGGRQKDEAFWCRKALLWFRGDMLRDPRYARVLPHLLRAYRQRFGDFPADFELRLR